MQIFFEMRLTNSAKANIINCKSTNCKMHGGESNVSNYGPGSHYHGNGPEAHELQSAGRVLVLQGPQGLAKTSFFRIMAPFPRWFVEGAVVDMGSKDSLITALSGWITELGELDSTLKKEQMSLKAFVTRPEDRIRMPYAKRDSRTPRRTSFCGTVNPKDYLKDETGSRRFWTIPVTNIDKKALFSLRPEWVSQVWFQAYDMYKADRNFFRLDDEEIKELQSDNREFEAPLRYELEIREMLDYSIPISQWEWWRAGEIAKLISGNADAGKVGKALSRIAKTLLDESVTDEFAKVTSITNNQELDFDHSSADVLVEKQRLLTNALAEAEAQAAELSEALEQA